MMENRGPTLADRYRRLAEYRMDFGRNHAAEEAEHQAERAFILEKSIAKHEHYKSAEQPRFTLEPAPATAPSVPPKSPARVS